MSDQNKRIYWLNRATWLIVGISIAFVTCRMISAVTNEWQREYDERQYLMREGYISE